MSEAFDSATRVQMLNEAVCLSYSANTPKKTYPSKPQMYGYLPPISQTIRTRHGRINDSLLWGLLGWCISAEG